VVGQEERSPRERRPDRDAPLVPQDLIDSIVSRVNPRRLILFGARARGEAGPDSDIDLLVVVGSMTNEDVRIL